MRWGEGENGGPQSLREAVDARPFFFALLELPSSAFPRCFSLSLLVFSLVCRSRGRN